MWFLVKSELLQDQGSIWVYQDFLFEKLDGEQIWCEQIQP